MQTLTRTDQNRRNRRGTFVGVLVAALALGPSFQTNAAPLNDSQSGLINYVALGDSSASAPWVLPVANEKCSRSQKNYPSALAKKIGARITDVSCSGAITNDITSQSQFPGIKKQIAALNSNVDLITVSTGGNDISIKLPKENKSTVGTTLTNLLKTTRTDRKTGMQQLNGLVSIALTCLSFNRSDQPCAKKFIRNKVDTVSLSIQALKPNFDNMIKQVKQKSPKADIVLVGYGVYVRKNGCWPTQPLLPTDANYLQSKVDELNETLRQVANENNILFFDTRSVTKGHDSCAAPAQRYIEGVIPLRPALPLHPNEQYSAPVAQGIINLVNKAGK